MSVSRNQSRKSSFLQFSLAFYFFLGVGAISLTARSQSEDLKSTYFMCKQSSYVRTIRIQLGSDGKACKTLYTKEGVDQIVGRSARAPDTCIEIASKIKTNLEAAKWKCKDISEAQVSSSVK